MAERAVPFEPSPAVRLVARGFDWIEYTAPIELREDVCSRLASLVAAAKEGEVAPVYLGARRPGDEWARQQRLDALPFVALPKSARWYKWGLENAELGISLWFTDSPHRPGVKVEIRSHALWHFGQLEAYQLTRRAVSELCKVGDGWPARPARIDLAVDTQGLGLTPDNAADIVSRAAKRETNTEIEQLCPRCGSVMEREDRRCARCAWPRWKFFEGLHRVGGIATAGCRPLEDEATGADEKPRWLFERRSTRDVHRKVWTIASAERSPIRPVYLPLAPLHRRQHGGYSGRKFTGWEYGAGGSNKVNVYLKTEEIRTKSPDKVWFYRTWGRARGYVFSRCPDCGRFDTQAEIVAADAPPQGQEAPRATKSGHARLVLRLCDFCLREHVVEPVWRVEARVRGDVLAQFAPRGRDTITTVDECFKYADELWHYVVGAPERRCIKCHDVPKGNEQRHRTCRRCELELRAELGRELTDAELKTIALRRRRGWFEARDSSTNPHGQPTRWPIAPWWQHIQSVHFDGSMPATDESRKLKALASADINRAMARGCALSAVDADSRFDAWAREHDGKPITIDAFKEMVRATVLGDDADWLAMFSRFADKRARRGLPPPELAELEQPATPASSGELDWHGRPMQPPTPIAVAPPPQRVYREVVFDLSEAGGPAGSRHGPHARKKIPF
jgi:uncharacterized OB-fold protein